VESMTSTTVQQLPDRYVDGRGRVCLSEQGVADELGLTVVAVRRLRYAPHAGSQAPHLLPGPDFRGPRNQPMWFRKTIRAFAKGRPGAGTRTDLATGVSQQRWGRTSSVDPDQLTRWIEQRAIIDPEAQAWAIDLWTDWSTWAATNQVEAGNRIAFGAALGRRGFSSVMHRRKSVWQGIRLVTDPAEE
jgi:hypothetical protein